MGLVAPSTNRDFKKRPEQFALAFSELQREHNQAQAQQVVWNREGDRIIVVGQQFDGSWGIKEYQVSGDTLTLLTVVL